MEFLFYAGFFVVGGVLGHISKEYVVAKLGQKPAKKVRKARSKKAKPEDAAPLGPQ